MFNNPRTGLKELYHDILDKKYLYPAFNHHKMVDPVYRFNFIKLHLPIVSNIINESIKYNNNEIKSIAVISLLTSLFTFNYSKGLAFPDYARKCIINDIKEYSLGNNYRLKIIGYISIYETPPSFVIPVFSFNEKPFIQNSNYLRDYSRCENVYSSLPKAVYIDKSNFLKMVYGFIDYNENIFFGSKSELLNYIYSNTVDDSSLLYLNILLFADAPESKINNCLSRIKEKQNNNSYFEKWYVENKENIFNKSYVEMDEKNKKDFFNNIGIPTYFKNNDNQDYSLIVRYLINQLNASILPPDEAKRKLVELHLRLVIHIIKKYQNTLSEDDLFSYGLIGLIKAVDTFMPHKGTQFATYAAKCIENEVLLALRSTKKVTCNVSLGDPIGIDKEGTEVSMLDILKTRDYEVFEEQRVLGIQTDEFYSLMDKCLTKRERIIIEMRYGLGGLQPQTQREIANRIGISCSYVSRIENKALYKLAEELKTNTDH